MTKQRFVACLVLLASGALALSACGGASNSANTTSPPTTSSAAAGLQPAALGEGQCDAGYASGGTIYAQIAVQSTGCDEVDTVAKPAGNAKGSAYSADGFSCTATAEGTGSEWASAWGGTYYAYSCKSGNEQIAFNWGTDYVYDGQGSTSTTSTPSTSGALQPSALGEGDCELGDTSGGGVYAQIAVSNAECNQVAAVADGAATADGSAYSAGGFSCTATAEGAGSEWASAWGSTYYAYSCKSGNEQIAFNWGTDYTY